jgi:hypothetical protein
MLYEAGETPAPRWEVAWTGCQVSAENLAMPATDFDLDSLARYLHVAPAQVLKLAERGNVPGRKIGGQWKFSPGEIHHWLEDRIGAGSEVDLAQVQDLLDRAADGRESESVTISELLLAEAIAIPLAARTRNSVIKSMVELAAKTDTCDPAEMAEAVQARESLHPTGARQWSRAVASAPSLGSSAGRAAAGPGTHDRRHPVRRRTGTTYRRLLSDLLGR